MIAKIAAHAVLAMLWWALMLATIEAAQASAYENGTRLRAFAFAALTWCVTLVGVWR